MALVARNKEKLEEVAKEIKDLYKVETAILIQDFGKLNSDEEVLALKTTVDDFLKDHDVSILVNNVGVARLGVLMKSSMFDIINSITVNTKA